MPRYIDGETMTRKEAITKLKIYRDYLCKMSSVVDVNEVAKPFNMAIEALDRNRGEWIGKPLGGYSTVHCSVCRSAFLENSGRWNFCPNCGVRMCDGND